MQAQPSTTPVTAQPKAPDANQPEGTNAEGAHPPTQPPAVVDGVRAAEVKKR